MSLMLRHMGLSDLHLHACVYIYIIFDFYFNLRTVLTYCENKLLRAIESLFLSLVGATWLKHIVCHCKSFLLGGLMDVWLVSTTISEIYG